jgi:Beta-1,3-glucanase
LIVPSTNANGNPLAIIPNSPADPNFDTLWDFIEGNWITEGDHTVFQWNPTQVNAFAIAFELDMKGGTPSDPKSPSEVILGFGTGGLRAKIFADIAAAGAPWNNLIIPDPMGGVPLRVLQPYYSIYGIGPGSGFPLHQLHDYIHNTIIPFYDQSTTNRLIYAGLLPLQWKGFTSGGKFIFEPDNKATTTTYTFSPPTTAECYGNTILGNPIDGNSNAIAAALGASILRSTLAFYPGFPVPQMDRNLYYTKPPFFEYAKIIHKYALNNHAFCFGYDEVAQDAGGTNQVWNPTSFAVTIRSL